jgi:tetratricopeptide (TPR) repeat protein
LAEITLRAYVKEIDDLVEHEQLDEAIAHSRHILETYPKHLDTYRLLGKAYLEAKRYGDAADLFQRVLSAIPDDFVAHIGMSIVREDEGNLDASIWHMERAFETNPANPAIQQELRRLIGKRDGLEPHKVRLTRGALARMYAHGELYPQAIAELRSALQEDPDRPDLQVLLANLYWRTDQKEPAAEVAQQILTKLPFCRDANRIAAGFQQGAGRTDEAAPLHRRLAALDPYAAFVETAMVDPTGVDAGSVHLEKLDWRPGHPVAAPDLSRPKWTDSLGAGLRAGSKPAAAAAIPEGPIPTWLADEEPSQAPGPAPAAPAAKPAPPPAPPPAAEDEASASVHPFAGAKPPPAADIPTWMREAGWAESTGEAVEGPVSFSDDELAGAAEGTGEGELAPASIPDWLKDVAPRQTGELGEDGAGTPTPERQAEAPAEPPSREPAREVPEAARPAKAGEVPTWLEEPAPGATETIVTWLGDRGTRAAAMQQAAPQPAEPEPIPEAEQPDWLTQGGFGDEEPSEEEPEAPETPPAWLTGVAEAAASEDALSAEPPSWVTEEVAESPEPVEEEFTPEPQTAQEAPDWLRSIAEPGSAPAAAADAEGDWLAGLTSAAAQPKPAESSGPEWLRGIAEREEQPAGQPEARSAPDWLRGLGGAEPPSSPAERTGPEWLREPSSAAEPAEPEAGLRAKAAGVDWLRGIGEEEPAPAEEAPSTASDDWLRGLVAMGAESAEQPEAEGEAAAWPEEAEAAEPQATPSETPDWLSRLAATAPPPESPAVEQPSWLEEVAAEGEPEAAPEPDWLSEMPGVAAAQPSPAPEPEEDWLKGLLDEAGLPPELAAAPADEAAEPDWFALQGAEGEPGQGPETEVRTRTTGWLREVGEQAVPPDAQEPPPAPDWLKEFEAAGGPQAAPTDATLVSIKGPGAGERPGGPRPPISTMDASTAGELGEDDVQQWLEALASRQEGGTGAAIEEAPPTDTGAPFPPAMTAEGQALPEEAGEGIGWLEQMAGQAEPRREPSVTSWQPVEQEPETPRVPELSAAEAKGEEEEEVPDWLRSLATEPASPEPVAEEAAADEQGPDWLLTAAASTVVARSSIQPPQVPVPPEPTEEPQEAEEAPSWLSVPAEEAAAPEPEPAAEAPADFEGAPDWLLTAAGEAEPAPEEAAYEEEETGIPDWLRKAAEVPESAEPVPTSYEPPEASAPVPPATPPEPSWMRPSEPAEARPVPAESEIVVPEWLRVPVEAPKPAETEPELVVPPPEVEQPKPKPAAEPTPPPPPAPAPPKVEPVAAKPAPAPVAAPAAPEAPSPAAAEPLAGPPAAKARTKARTVAETLDAAREAVASDDLKSAAKHYGTLIRRRSLLDDVVADLEAIVERQPENPELWQVLGDAYMKANRAAEAVEAYRHGLASL